MGLGIPDPGVGDCEICALVGRRMGKFNESPFVCLREESVLVVAVLGASREGISGSRSDAFKNPKGSAA